MTPQNFRTINTQRCTNCVRLQHHEIGVHCDYMGSIPKPIHLEEAATFVCDLWLNLLVNKDPVDEPSETDDTPTLDLITVFHDVTQYLYAIVENQQIILSLVYINDEAKRVEAIRKSKELANYLCDLEVKISQFLPEVENV